MEVVQGGEEGVVGRREWWDVGEDGQQIAHCTMDACGPMARDGGSAAVYGVR